MAKIISTPKDELAKWSARVTCGNALCRATLEVTASDLFLRPRDQVGLQVPIQSPNAFPSYRLSSNCPACHHTWFLNDTDAGKVPTPLYRKLLRW